MFPFFLTRSRVPGLHFLVLDPRRSLSPPRGLREGSEGNVVVVPATGVAAERFVRWHRRAHVFGGPLAAAAEHLHVLRDDLGGVTLLPLLILPLPGLDATFDVDLAALGEVLAADLGELAEADHAVPLGGFLLRSALVRPALGGGHAQVRDRLPALGESHLRVRAEV